MTSNGDDPKIVEFPKAEISPEERARRLQAEIERQARLPLFERVLYLEDAAKTHGIKPAKFKALVEAIVRENEKKVREAKADNRYERRRVEQKQEREGKRTRQDEEHARKEAERARKEAERVEREQGAKRKKREATFAEIADLPKLTHEVRLKEAAKRLGEDFEPLAEEFEVFLAAREIPEELEPWPEPVDTAELLETIEAKFRRYVVAPDAIVTASVLWSCFTYIAEIATHAPKLVYTFPERDAGKSTALHTLRWMSQRAYMAVDVTAAVTFRILDRLRPALFLDEADSAFSRGTVLATIFNTSWLNGGSKIPRTGRHGEIEEFECYGPQAFAMRKLCMPDTTLSRCIVCMIWPKLPSEVVEDFGFCDDDEFKVIRRKAMRWAIDNATTLRSAVPVLPPGFTNRIRVNWKMLLAIAELAGGAWPKRVREAALTLEIDRDEPSADIRLFQGLQDIWGDVTEQNRSSQNICMALRAHPSGEWADINPIGLAVRLRPFNIHPVHNLRPTKPSEQDRARGGGYRRSQFERDAWPRLLGNSSPDSLTRSPGDNPRRKRE